MENSDKNKPQKTAVIRVNAVLWGRVLEKTRQMVGMTPRHYLEQIIFEALEGVKPAAKPQKPVPSATEQPITIQKRRGRTPDLVNKIKNSNINNKHILIRVRNEEGEFSWLDPVVQPYDMAEYVSLLAKAITRLDLPYQLDMFLPHAIIKKGDEVGMSAPDLEMVSSSAESLRYIVDQWEYVRDHGTPAEVAQLKHVEPDEDRVRQIINQRAEELYSGEDGDSGTDQEDPA